METRNVPCVVIGAGQAGLAMSHQLREAGVDHVVLERGEIAQRWRTERWDSFTLLSPNWQTRLPGHHYRGDDPDGFLTGAGVVELLERYARRAPVRCGTAVHRVAPTDDGRWTVDTSAGRYVADDVVVATGHLDRPRIPTLAERLPVEVVQLHTSHYRNPDQLPAGPVLVVGAGPSGQQIALELARSGREVHLAVGRHRALPRRYRGHDTYWWLDRMGSFRRTVDTLPDVDAELRSPNAVLTGGTRDLDVHRLVAHGVVAHGRLLDRSGGTLRFAADLRPALDDAAANATKFRERVDGFVARTGLDACPEVVVPPSTAWADAAPTSMPLAGLAGVVWATGFRRDLSWIDAPVFDPAGDPVHRRGITAAPGLTFLGLKWQHRRSSSFLDGVGPDAEHLAGHVAARREATRVPA